jgi:CRP-like cAMP-binding protein
MNFIWENIFKKTKESDLQTILSENILFRDLSPREIRFVHKIVHVRRFHPNEMIFRQGETGVGMYMIMKGRVEIFTTDENAPSPEFQNIFITQLLPGDFFGELSLVEEGSHRAASAIAREETTLIGFFRPDLMEILARRPSTGVKIIFRLAEVLGRRLKETTNKVSELRAALKELRVPPPLTSGPSSSAPDSTNEYASKY